MRTTPGTGRTVPAAARTIAGQQRITPGPAIAPHAARRAQSLALLVGLALVAGCTPTPGPPPAAPAPTPAPVREGADLDSLHEQRTDHVGDNSAVVALVTAADVDALGEYTLALATTERPYQVRITFPDTVTPPSQADEHMLPRAALLLATIGNADEVHWSFSLGDARDSRVEGIVTRTDVDEALGQPVASLGATVDGLEELVDRLGP